MSVCELCVCEAYHPAPPRLPWLSHLPGLAPFAPFRPALGLMQMKNEE